MLERIEREVISFFTLARKFPKLIGRLHDGTAIPGGPYTPTQFVVMAAVFIPGWASRKYWSFGFGLFDIALLVPLAWIAGFLMGLIPLGARNPLMMATGLGGAVFATSAGETGGRKPATRRPRTSSRVVVRGDAGKMPPARTKPSLQHRKATNQRSPVSLPTPPAPSAATAPMTGIQHLLAQTSSARDEARH
ncbi:MAG: hypothetical protein L0G87_00410 [Renibacterium salmoninarum]|nr:hypothetical protein [Renibacterium salmoninarum]